MDDPGWRGLLGFTALCGLMLVAGLALLRAVDAQPPPVPVVAPEAAPGEPAVAPGHWLPEWARP